MWSYRRKGSRLAAACWILLGAAVATSYAASAVKLHSLGYAITSVGWFGYGLAQGYRLLYDSPPDGIDDATRARIGISRYAMLMFFVLMVVGIAIRYAK